MKTLISNNQNQLNANNNFNLIPFAQLPWYAQWCVTAHGSQMYDDKPYQFHIEGVAGVALRFGFTDEATQKECWCHDVKEDTGQTEQDLLQAGFSQDEADVVEAVTNVEAPTAAEAKAKTLPKIKANRQAIKVKLCDRIFNVEYGKPRNSPQFFTYRKGYPEFKRVLFDENDQELRALWDCLDALFA
jgi:(p)ppGpp synthase/HD superfamily hydrolase